MAAASIPSSRVPRPPVPRPSSLLRTWLSARPRGERLIFLLTYADGLSVAEIADVLELGESYVSETLRVARDEAAEVAAGCKPQAASQEEATDGS